MFMKGTYNLRPPTQKYYAIWHPNRLLKYIETMDISSPMGISKKTSSLFMLLLGQKVNSLSHLKITNMFLTVEEWHIHNWGDSKTLKVWIQKPLVLRSFPGNKELCPVQIINQYLNFRLTKTNDAALFKTTTIPHRKCSSDTIARWIKSTIQAAGIDSGKYTVHSLRSASTSSAKVKGVSLTTIIQAASWSNTTVFQKHYNEEILENYFIEHTNGKLIYAHFFVCYIAFVGFKFNQTEFDWLKIKNILFVFVL